MILEKVQIPVYNDLILKRWEVPVTKQISRIRKDAVGLFSENVLDENGKPITALEFKKSITENPEYFTVKNEYMKLINDFRENETDQFVGGMPVQLEKDCLSQLLRGTNYEKLIYGITLKVNGIRHLMFLSKTGNLYFIDRVTNFFYFKNETLKPTKFPFIFDGELVQHKNGNWEFLIFDVIIYNNFNWLSNNYYDRLYIMDQAINKDFKDLEFNFDISLKTWFPIETIKDTTNIYKYIVESTNKERKKLKKPELEEDGLVLQPFDGNYVTFRAWNLYNNIQFKWKPPKELTVDFEIKFDSANKKVWWLLTNTGQNYNVSQKKGPPIHAIIIPTPANIRDYSEGDVVECKLSEFSNNVFIPIRKREKKEGNSLETIMSTMRVVENPFTLDILKPAINSILTGTNPEEVLKFYSLSKIILCSIDMFFTDSEIESIKKIYNIYFEKESVSFGKCSSFGAFARPQVKRGKIEKTTKKWNNYELEFRIFPYIKKGVKENIKKFTYFYFLDFLKKNFKINEENTIDFISTEGEKTYRSTYTRSKKPINIIKNRITTYNSVPLNDKQLYNNLTFKLSLSTEIESSVNVGLRPSPGVIGYDIIRIKQRSTFNINPFWRIDMTKITTITRIHEPGIESYELECEYIGPREIPFKTFIESMNYVYKLILSSTSYC